STFRRATRGHTARRGHCGQRPRSLAAGSNVRTPIDVSSGRGRPKFRGIATVRSLGNSRGSMHSGRGGTYVSLAGFLVVVGLLSLIAAQLHGIETKLVVQGQQIRALGEAADRLSARGPAPASSGIAPEATIVDEQPDHVLHPDV